MVFKYAGGTSQIAVEAIEGCIESNRAAVNLITDQVAVAGGSGVDAANVVRVSLATDIPLPAGAAEIGFVNIQGRDFDAAVNLQVAMEAEHKALLTATIPDELVNRGEVFRFASFRTLANGVDLDIVITTPASPNVSLQLSFNTTGQAQSRLFESPTGVSGGTPLVPFDINRRTANTSTVTVTENPTIGATGALLQESEIGSVSKGNEDFGGEGLDGRGQVFPQFVVRW